MFNRRHYEVVAGVVRTIRHAAPQLPIGLGKAIPSAYEQGVCEGWHQAVNLLDETFRHIFEEDNPRFDSLRYDRAVNR